MTDSQQSIGIVSHPLCPFAQRLRLILLRKGLREGEDFYARYIDLANVPNWFRTLSPQMKMPVLTRGDRAIALHPGGAQDYLEETIPSRLLPEDAEQRAVHRDWLAVADELLEKTKGVYTAQTQQALDVAKDILFDLLLLTEQRVPQGRVVFDGHRFSMVDAAFASFFSLVLFTPETADDSRWSALPTLRRWGDALLMLDDVSASKCANYAAEFEYFYRVVGSVLGTSESKPAPTRISGSSGQPTQRMR